MRRFAFLFVFVFVMQPVFPQSLDTLLKRAFITTWKMYSARGCRPFYAYRVLGVDRQKDQVDYYLLLLQAGYKVVNGHLKTCEMDFFPVRLVKRDTQVVAYLPQEGEGYSESIKKNFPSRYHEMVFNMHKYFNSDSAMAVTRRKALNYWHFVRVYVFYPADQDQYEKLMNDYVDGKISNPLQSVQFKRKPVYLAPTDSIKYYLALEQYRLYPPFGNESEAVIPYFKQRADTLYILLNADVDGWAGVSYFLARVHPLIERALLQFPDVRHVVWDYAPDDKN